MKTPDPAARAVEKALQRFLATGAAHGHRRARIAIALSGGRDSMLLLDVMSAAGADFAIDLSAIHVHHGLSPNADAWAEFCARECAKRCVPLVTRRVAVDRGPGTSLEACARAARHAEFASLDVDALALAHHADDQAETLWLQLLRGAGPHGLAGMSADRVPDHGPRILRPLLTLDRAALAAVANVRGLNWVDDESNADRRIRRNFIRHEISPRLAKAFPGYPDTLLRAASHQAEAALLLDELAALDAEGALAWDTIDGATLDCLRLRALADSQAHRARNLLRWFLRRHHLRAPSTARLAELISQLTTAGMDARVRIAHDGHAVSVHRGFVHVHETVPLWPPVTWPDEVSLALPHGQLTVRAAAGAGVAVQHLETGAVVVRARQGGERLRLGPQRARQLLTHVMQQQGIPHWRRDTWPLIYCAGALAAVPGIGVDAQFAAPPGLPGRVFDWLPRSRPEAAS